MCVLELESIHVAYDLEWPWRSFISFRAFEMLVVYICAALYKISTGTPASRGPSATAGLLVLPRELCSARRICHGRVSVCVCVSVTSRCSTKMAKHTNMQTTPHDITGTLVFWCQKPFRNSNEVTRMGAPNAGVVGRSWRISTNNSPYLENGTRYRI